MVLPLIPIVIGMVGSTIAGGMLAKSDGAGDKASWGGTIDKTQWSSQTTNTLNETISNTMNFQPSNVFSPNYSFNPMTAIGSGEFNMTKKEAYANALNPSWDTPNNVSPSSQVVPTTSQGMNSGGSGDIMDSIKQYAFLGVIGFVAYKYFVGGKK